MRRPRVLLIASISLASFPSVISAQTPVGPSVSLGGYIQTQYTRISMDGGDPRDRVLFRRIMLWAQSDLGEHWSAEVEADVAPATLGERILVRDAYLRYSGLRDGHFIVTLGNQKMPFSRSALTGASKRGFVERPVTGERPFGAPGRALALRADGRHVSRSFQWSGAIASAFHRPGVEQINIDGLATSDADWNEGVLVAGRGEWHPLGPVPLDQGAFDVKTVLVTIGVAAYYWRNDGDVNPYTIGGVSVSELQADLHDSSGLELSGGIRTSRVSLDAELHRIAASTLDDSFTGGLYRAGSARLFKTAVEAGYMLLPARFELLGGVDTLAADGRDAIAWRPAFGLNWYVRRHRLKFQFMHREAFRALGVRGARTHSTLLQAQFAF